MTCTAEEMQYLAGAIRDYQMARNRRAIREPIAMELPSDFQVDEDGELFWADDLISGMRDFLREPLECATQAEAAENKLERLRNYDVGAIRYDKTRVMGGDGYDLCDRISDVMDAEENYRNLSCVCVVVSGDVMKLLRSALDSQAAQVWYDFYVLGMSMGAIATKHGLKKRRVQWLIEKKQNVVDVTLAFKRWMQGIEFYRDEVESDG